jgi:hypothetical protein
MVSWFGAYLRLSAGRLRPGCQQPFDGRRHHDRQVLDAVAHVLRMDRRKRAGPMTAPGAFR